MVINRDPNHNPTICVWSKAMNKAVTISRTGSENEINVAKLFKNSTCDSWLAKSACPKSLLVPV